MTSKQQLVLALCGVASFGISSNALADTVTNVSIPYSTTGLYGGNWSNAINGSTIAAAPQGGNTGSGITFADWSGYYNEVTPGQTTTFSIGSVALGSTSSVNTLLNTFYGDYNLDAIVTFTNSLSQTDTFDVVGGDTIRDYNQNSFQNGLLGGTPGVLTAENWWNNGADGQRLDVQTFDLPGSWNGTDLVSMSIYNPSTPPDNPSPDDDLSALQVVSSPQSVTPPATGVTPEPSSLVLLGTGVLGMAGALRRKFVMR